MRARASIVWEAIRSSFWFLPVLLLGFAIALSFVMVEIDERVSESWIQGREWLWTGSPQGARGILSTIAGSMITVAGVVFSITIVTLTLAASQFGSRLLRTFMRDPGNQFVLGIFVSTFIYCLLVLRSVRALDAEQFVPHLAITGGILLAVLSVGVLVYFIHHLTESIRAESLIASVANELLGSIDRIFPQKLGQPPSPQELSEESEPEVPPDLERRAFSVAADENGYLQAVDGDTLMKAAREHDVILRLLQQPGDFVTAGNTLAEVWPLERCRGGLPGAVMRAFILGRHRTPTQDVEYSAHQIVEVAVRSIRFNDPSIAINCIDWLGAGLSRMAERRIPSIYRHDEAGRLRVIARTTTFPDLADVTFNQLRQAGAQVPVLALRLLEIIKTVGGHVRRQADRASLRHHASLIRDDALAALQNEHDRIKVEEFYREALLSFEEPGGGRPGSERSDRA